MKSRLTESQRIIRWQEIQLAVQLYNGTCACGREIRQQKKTRTNISFKGFLFHHLTYEKDSPRRKDYASMWKYKADLIQYIESHPTEFVLCCKGCHEIIEKLYRVKKARPVGFLGIIKTAYDTHT